MGNAVKLVMVALGCLGVVMVAEAQIGPPPSAAPSRTPCAISFSRRLAAARASINDQLGRGVQDIQIPASQDNVDCMTEDDVHRIPVVIRPGAQTVDLLQLLCYGDANPRCDGARDAIERRMTPR